MQSTHLPTQSKTIVRTLKLPGIYDLYLDGSEKIVPVTTKLRGFSSEAPISELKGAVRVMLAGSTILQGEKIISGKQLFRIIGIPFSKNDSPVIRNNATFRFEMRDEFKSVVRAINAYLFD